MKVTLQVGSKYWYSRNRKHQSSSTSSIGMQFDIQIPKLQKKHHTHGHTSPAHVIAPNLHRKNSNVHNDRVCCRMLQSINLLASFQSSSCCLRGAYRSTRRFHVTQHRPPSSCLALPQQRHWPWWSVPWVPCTLQYKQGTAKALECLSLCKMLRKCCNLLKQLRKTFHFVGGCLIANPWHCIISTWSCVYVE